MKRFASIISIAVLVLTMSVSTAYAGVCMGMDCSDATWECADARTSACPMGEGGVTVSHACDHESGRDSESKDAVASQTMPEHPLAAAPLVLPAPVLPSGLAAVSVAPDARGAPHLTAVIRI